MAGATDQTEVQLLRRKSTAKRSYPTPKVRGGDQECWAAMAQEQPRGAIPRLRSGAAADRNNPTSKEQRLCGRRRAERSYSMFKVRRGDLVQGKEQQLCFAGAAVKR